jgi:LPXTG-site transpeptidase (sortase) family protein
MNLILSNNRSMAFGFVLAICSLAGMYLVVFKPITFSPTREGIGALPIPLKPIYEGRSKPELKAEVEYYPKTLGAQSVAQDEEISFKTIDLSINTLSNTTNPGNPTAPLPDPEIPLRIMIPSINLDAPIVPAQIEFERLAGKEFIEWFVPEEYAVGWHTTSAKLGAPGNTVLNGHHNAYGEVFKDLVGVNEGDYIWVASEESRFKYLITNKMLLPEKYEQLDVRTNNAQWILPSVDERLTLITCWPYETNTHRLIVVARPLSREEITPELE